MPQTKHILNLENKSYHSYADNYINNLTKLIALLVKQFTMPISKMLKDQFYRQQVSSTEHLRNALKFVIRTDEAPQKQRILAQYALSESDVSTRPHAVRNRCIYTGRSRFVLKDLKMCRQQLKERVKDGKLDLQISKW